MKTFRIFLMLSAFATAMVFTTSGTIAGKRNSTPRTIAPATHQSSVVLFGNAALDRDLKTAYAATAKYNSVKKAEADGYLVDVYEEGEGLHYFNPAFYEDGVIDIERPEAILYVPDENGHLHLAALEYLLPYDPNAPLPPAPEGFAGNEDVWRSGDEGFPEWALNVWIWTYNPDGVFAKLNPLVP